MNVRFTKESAQLAKAAAAAQGVPLSEYMEKLVRDDAEGLRDAFLAGAKAFLVEWGDLVDEVEASAR